jgi:hypothetical protein
MILIQNNRFLIIKRQTHKILCLLYEKMRINYFSLILIHLILIIWIGKNNLISKSKGKFLNNYLVKKS